VIPSRDDVAAAVHVDAIEHQHRQPNVIQAAGHQLAETLARARD
jgi:hypothetical protein